MFEVQALPGRHDAPGTAKPTVWHQIESRTHDEFTAELFNAASESPHPRGLSAS